MRLIKEVMTCDVRVARPEESLRDAASTMAVADIGSLPVRADGKLIGMLTDRDIVVRAVAEGRADSACVADVMTRELNVCYDDERVLDVAQRMSELGIRRLPVLNRDKQLVGIVALSNIASGGTEKARDALLDGVATPH
jgi:CBS domain-containing protein